MDSKNNKINTMWNNEKFYNSNFINYEFADFYTQSKVLWLWFKWYEILKSINNPYVHKYNNLDKKLLNYESYSILFIIFSKNDDKSMKLLQNNISKLKKSHDLLIWIILDENNEINFEWMFNSYFVVDDKDVNLIIEWILWSIVLSWLICLDWADIISFFNNAWKLNFYKSIWSWSNKVQDIVWDLKDKYTLNTTHQFFTIFISNLWTMYDVDEIAKWIIKEGIEDNVLFSSPILEALGDEICCFLFSN